MDDSPKHLCLHHCFVFGSVVKCPMKNVESAEKLLDMDDIFSFILALAIIANADSAALVEAT